MASRYDNLGRLDAKTRTPQGGISAPANLTRTGVFYYRLDDGTVRKELRHPDEVFKPESLASLRGAPVTVGHPGMVTTKTFKKDSVGHVGDDVRQDQQFIAATVRIQDQETVAKIEREDLVELSCGYDCKLIDEPGEYEGEKYDARQTDIVYNHVGLGPRGWGRAGGDVKLRLDGGETYTNHVEPKVQETPAPAPVPTTVTVHVDGAEVERLRGENTALKAQIEALKASAPTAEQIDARVDARLALRDSARKVLGADAKLDGKSDLAIITEVVNKAFPSFKCDGKSEDFLRGMFESAVSQAAVSPDPSLAGARTDAATPNTVSSIDAARERFTKRNAEAYANQGSKK